MTTEMTVEEIKQELAEDAERWPAGINRHDAIEGVPLYDSELPPGQFTIGDNGRIELLDGANIQKSPPLTADELYRWAIDKLNFASLRMCSGNEVVRRLAIQYAEAVLGDLPLWTVHFDIELDVPSQVTPVEIKQLLADLTSRTKKLGSRKGPGPKKKPTGLTLTAERQIVQAWRTGGYTTYAELAHEKRTIGAVVKRLVESDRRKRSREQSQGKAPSDK
jgi:hypothetical protein